MTIVKCNKCGELIHKADRCFLCGNTSDFTKVDSTFAIHENVKDEYIRLDQLVRNGKFQEALDLSRVVLEWMPSCSDVFWLRLLAKSQCVSDEALIRKGVSCEDSADYCNAVMFADESQKRVYAIVAKKISLIKNVLAKYITEHEYSEKNGTAILQHQSEMPATIEAHRKKLFELWKELKEIEHSIAAVEEDCLLLINEHKESLDKASSEAADIKNRTYKMEQCTADDLHKYQTQFGDLLYRSEQAKSSIDSMRSQHPWMSAYSDLIKKRDAAVSQINSELNSLKTYESRVQSTVSEIERIEARHTAALSSVTNYRFSEIRSLLGETRFTAAYVESGIK